MRTRGRASLAVWQVAVFVLAVLAWEGLAARGVLDPFFFSRPSHVAARIYQWFSIGSIYRHLLVTTQETVYAFLAGTALGVIAGFVFARVPLVSRIFDPYIKISNALPRIVLAPIFTLWFGLGILSKVVFGVTLVFFIVLMCVPMFTLMEVDRNILNNARMLGASERDLVRHVLLPSALTWILASLHTSVGLALVGAVVGEYLGSARGLGYLIAQAEGLFDTTGVFAGIVVLSVFVLAIDGVVTLTERKLLVWKPGVQSEG